MRRISLLAVVLAIAGCATAIPGPESISSGDAQAQVRSRLGPPTAERKLVADATAWYYATGPSSFYTWRVLFDRAGTVTEYAQVLTAANFAKFAQGASRDALLDLVGPPMQRMSFARSATEAWTYRWMDGTLEMIADAVFDARGDLVHIALYRDPAFSSPQSSER